MTSKYRVARNVNLHTTRIATLICSTKKCAIYACYKYTSVKFVEVELVRSALNVNNLYAAKKFAMPTNVTRAMQKSKTG